MRFEAKYEKLKSKSKKNCVMKRKAINSTYYKITPANQSEYKVVHAHLQGIFQDKEYLIYSVSVYTTFFILCLKSSTSIENLFKNQKIETFIEPCKRRKLDKIEAMDILLFLLNNLN